jgi:hypothetical protein
MCNGPDQLRLITYSLQEWAGKPAVTWTRQRLPGHESRPQCYIVTVCKLITKAETANFTLSEAVIPRAHKKA